MARPQSSRKKLLDSFGERYHVIKHDGGYLLYDKEGYSKRANALYLGYFFISTNGLNFKFNDNYYPTKEELIEAINEYNKTLQFDAEIYNPTYRKNWFVRTAFHDYMESIGFVRVDDERVLGQDDFYVLKDGYGQEICEICITVEEDTTTGKVKRKIKNEDKWELRCTESEFTDLDSAIGAVNSILAMYCASINAITMNVLNGLTNSRVSSVFDKTFDVRRLTTYTEDAKKKTIEMLESELKKLKGEI